MHVAVLTGGESPEREVAFWSAENVVGELERAGLDVSVFDVPSELETFLKHRARFSCVVPVLHGGWGEDGTIQGFLETLNMPYIFSGVTASAVAMRCSRGASPCRGFGPVVSRRREAGLLGICVPEEHGGWGADFATYVMTAAEIGRHCGATALTLNMHVSSTMWTGFIADDLDMTPEQRAKELIAATHIDGTVRPHTVSQKTNPQYWKLIREFYALTGIPAVLNTSFNLSGEPIVCTPYDAISTFLRCGLDYLVLGDFLIAKSPISNFLK